MTFKREVHHPWLKEFPWFDIQASQLLQKVSEESANCERPAWVLDLDSTLFSVSRRTRTILYEFLRGMSRARPDWWLLLNALDESCFAYSVQETFELGFRKFDSRDAQEKARELWAAFETAWMEKFFLGRYMFFDQPYPGAVDFVQGIAALGFDIVYLTGRDHQKAFGESWRSLKASGFPTNSKTRLILKPWQWGHLSDLEYKARASRVIGSQVEVVCCLDNEPENLVAFAKAFPKSSLVLFHSVMSKRRPSEAEESCLKDRDLFLLGGYSSQQYMSSPRP